MSGHSKWASIKHKKAAVDAKRGKIFSRMSKEITIAAKLGGGEIDMNPRLRSAVQAAKAVNMPADNIDRAIKKGTGELPGVTYEEITYEAYGPAGVGIIIEVLTDNRNRATGEVRSTVEKRGGSLAGSGAVAWQFNKKGLITVETSAVDEETLFLLVSEAGADDMITSSEIYEIITSIDSLEAVKSALEAESIPTIEAGLSMLPASTVKIESAKDGTALFRLLEYIEDLDDVQNVYSNFEMEEELMQQVAG
jgi:YebC/PmpR family DNA-binding regulatory protein